MEKDNKPFLERSLMRSDYAIFIATEVLNKTAPIERLNKLEELVSTAAMAHNDEACLKLLELLKRAYEVAAYDLAGTEIANRKSYEQERISSMRAEEQLHRKLTEIYWKLPDKENETYRDSVHQSVATLVDSKQWILKEIARHWEEKIEPQSISAFRFLCVAFDSTNRAIYPKERENILQIIREKTGGLFKPEQLEGWLKEPNIPNQIQQILVIARARNGGVELAKRDIRNAEFLKCFKLEERSPAAIALLQDFMERVTRFDASIQVLFAEMRNGWLNNEQIGESECVYGKISTTVISNLLDMSLDVALREDCPEPLGRDIYGRACRHVQKWFDKGHGPKGGTVSVAISGGKDNLHLSTIIRG